MLPGLASSQVNGVISSRSLRFKDQVDNEDSRVHKYKASIDPPAVPTVRANPIRGGGCISYWSAVSEPRHVASSVRRPDDKVPDRGRPDHSSQNLRFWRDWWVAYLLQCIVVLSAPYKTFHVMLVDYILYVVPVTLALKHLRPSRCSEVDWVECGSKILRLLRRHTCPRKAVLSDTGIQARALKCLSTSF